MRRTSTRAAGLLILILGAWGGLVPFVAPYFHFAMGPDKSWTWTSGRLWLDVLPGIVAVIGGLLLLGAGPRPSGKLGALMALAAGIWFAIGPAVSLLWNASGAEGAAHGSTGIRVLEMLTYHTLLGAVIAALAAYSLPGLVTRRAAAAAAEEDAVAPAPVPEAVTGDEPAATTRVRRPVRDEEPTAATRVDRPVHDDEPVRRGSDTTREPVASGVSRGDDDTQTAVVDRPTSSERLAPDRVDPPANGSTSQDRTDAGTPAPSTTRRRQGGLLGRLRR